MGFILTGIFLAVLLGLMARSMQRDRWAVAKAETIRKRLAAAYALDQLYVSRDNGSFVGLTPDDAILLGDDAGEQLWPMTSIQAVEGLRDGVVLVRAARDGGDVGPASVSRNPADLPERIRTLSLRVVTADAEKTVLFFDGGKHGVAPAFSTFRESAALTETWFRTLREAIRGAA